MAATDKHWAKEYILDPLTAPQPSDETGPGSHFRPPPSESAPRTSTPPRSPHHAKTPSQSHGSPQLTSTYPSPPHSSSSPKSATYRTEAFSPSTAANNTHHRRRSSLAERYPGDTSHRPLSQLTQEKARADKSRHVTKKHTIRPDTIDQLDSTSAGSAYHHSGPYDATLFARNNSYTSSPVAAVASTTEETLKATPKDKIADSLERHRPLDGVAAYAPGETDREGNTYDYEAGENMMTDLNPGGGAYKRWPGVQYHPDDIKGKGEPSYSVEKALKGHEDVKREKRDSYGVERGSMEMADRTRRSSGNPFLSSSRANDDDVGGEGKSSGVGMGRSDSLSKRLSGGLKKRIGSIKRKTEL